MNPPDSHRPFVVGGRSNIKTIDSEHPLADDSDVSIALKSQESTILKAYAKAKNISQEETKGIKFEPVCYCTQVVAGSNYFIKLRVTHGSKAEEYIHVTIYTRPWEKIVELTNLEINKKASDAIN